MPDVPLPDPADSPLDRARAAVATALGVDPARVRVVDPAWLRLMQDGVLVSLHIRRWRATARLTLDDLGLPPTATEDAALADLLQLGEKRLLPKALFDALNSLESGARKALERFSFKTFWGYFLPATAYADWQAVNADYQARYFALRDRIVADYDTILADLTMEYRRAARAAYRRLNVLDPAYMTTQDWQEEQAFVGAFVARIRALIPSAAEIGASFGFQADLQFVPLPSLLAADLAQKERIEAETVAARAAAHQAQDQAWATTQAERTRAQEAAAQERRRAEARAQMEQDVLRHAAAQKTQLVDSFLADLVAQLRALVYEATTDVLASLDKNGDRLVGKSAEQLRNLVAQVGRLNFFGDTEIDAAMARVQALLGPAPKDRDVGDLKAQLGAIATVTRATLLDLGERPRSAHLVGVADAPTPDLLRHARRTLGLDTPEALPTDAALPPTRQARPWDRAADRAPRAESAAPSR